MQPFTDERGQFARAWCSEEFARRGLMAEFVQSNVSINPKTGTLRGLHWQEPPYAEVKLVRCVRGAVRSEEHTSELQSLMRISYAVFCLKKKKKITNNDTKHIYDQHHARFNEPQHVSHTSQRTSNAT